MNTQISVVSIYKKNISLIKSVQRSSQHSINLILAEHLYYRDHSSKFNINAYLYTLLFSIIDVIQASSVEEFKRQIAAIYYDNIYCNLYYVSHSIGSLHSN